MKEIEHKIIKMILGKSRKLTDKELEEQRQEYNETVKKLYGVKNGKSKK